MADVTLTFVAQGGWVQCAVTFPSAEVALATLKRWHAEDIAAGHGYSQVWAQEDEDSQVYPSDRIGPVSKGEFDLLDYLYPTCHHGMDLQLCMDPYGPHHWGTMEQELAGIL